MEKMTPLLSTCFITSIEADLLFFRGILQKLQLKICDQLPEAHTKVHSPPSMDNVLALLRKEFDKDDILDKDNDDIASNLKESDFDLSDANYNKNLWKSKKRLSIVLMYILQLYRLQPHLSLCIHHSRT